MRLFMFLAIFVVCSVCVVAQEGAQYLYSAISELKSLNSVPKTNPVEVPNETRKIHRSEIPPLSLTKGELTALYETAISKGNAVKIDHVNGPSVHAAVHQMTEDHPIWAEDDHIIEHTTTPPPEEGYFYYYYPLKSFMDEMKSHPMSDPVHHEDYHHSYPPHHHHHPPVIEHTTSPPIVPQYHSHTHEHKVHITPMKSMMEGDKKSKALEPLFMAISGFIGMAIMFFLSVIVFPKFGIMKSRGVKYNNNEVTSVARIALQAVEGQDCAERLACELGKTARAFNLYNNRFVKLLRRMVTTPFKKQIDKIGKYTDKKHKCAVIQCKRKKAPPQKKTNPGKKTN